MSDYNKTFSVGKFSFTPKKERQYKAEIIVSIENEDTKPVLRISGNIYEEDPKNPFQSGQCIETIARYIHTKKMKKIHEIWQHWNNNDLHAGCIHQRDFEKEHYLKHKDSICEICNYKYGTSWIYEELPPEIISEVKSW